MLSKFFDFHKYPSQRELFRVKIISYACPAAYIVSLSKAIKRIKIERERAG